MLVYAKKKKMMLRKPADEHFACLLALLVGMAAGWRGGPRGRRRRIPLGIVADLLQLAHLPLLARLPYYPNPVQANLLPVALAVDDERLARAAHAWGRRRWTAAEPDGVAGVGPCAGGGCVQEGLGGGVGEVFEDGVV